MTPRSPESFERMRAESRERILASALDLFARHGYRGTSVRRIAEEAGVSQGLLYNYFEGKEGVLRAVFLESRKQVGASLRYAAEGATPAERLDRLVRGALRSVRDDLSFWRITYQLRMQPEVLEGLGESVREWTEETRRGLEGVLRSAGVPSAGAEARVLFAAIDGAAQHFALDPEGYPLDEVATRLARRFRPPASPARPEPPREVDP